MGRHPDRVRRALRYAIPVLSALVAAALIASVLAPAHESARVLALLDDDRRLIEPARFAVQQIESGIAEESAERQRFDASRDAASLRRAQTAMAQVDAAVRELRTLTSGLDGSGGNETSSLVRLVAHWREVAGDSSFGALNARARLGTMAAREAVRDSIVAETTRVQEDLAWQALQWRATLAVHERRGLLVNAMLVLVAIVAIVAVLEMTRRELGRARREAALRQAAEAYAAEARDGRERLERAMDSRGRLMRGFSHEVKNPLGAADGYAALLRDGVYGPVTEEQGLSIDRIRKSIHRALTLIDDLHELARAETGKLAVKLEHHAGRARCHDRRRVPRSGRGKAPETHRGRRAGPAGR